MGPQGHLESAATRDADAELAPFARRVEREARRCIDYIRRSRRRMRYQAFRAMGLCVAARAPSIREIGGTELWATVPAERRRRR